jgi:hypothetical protein
MKKHKGSQWLNYLGMTGGALSSMAREERLKRRAKRAAKKKTELADQRR